ncbi:HupE/UreJ family protein [Adhaeribacter soli]|uniref:HupE/UreJ family protein n=1 Tax=Adhaeribacter soli TaxID=2607655 RepID=A0A5N1J2E6_9BACT|nr:HupE/UreJ family protein [Adhaeribacter soli]KAA9340918.1 HupE/UreJ family protein [Adhaeribacter soli]
MNASTFSAYLQVGFHHIFNLQAYDHLAFLVALAAPFIWRNWRNVVLLATAFTIGHSVTLALAVLQIIPVNESLIETLIPVTILFTSLFNIYQYARPEQKTVGFGLQNLLAAGFGLIHGMGFSNYLRSLLGKESKPVLELFAFNVGIEIGQVLIVLLALLLNTFAVRLLPRKTWIMVVSGVTALVSIYILFGIFAS